MNIQENINLAQFSSFHIGGPAKFFCEVNNENDLAAALELAYEKGLAILVLAGGSNILINDRGFSGLVLKINMKGIGVVEENDSEAIINAAAGETWDDVVKYVVEHNWWGIENLSLIPGQMGAAPVQNIGAYGQEISSTVHQVIIFDKSEKAVKTLDNKKCCFAYRKSIFNSEDKDKYVILEVFLKLKKNGMPKLNYPDLCSWANRLGRQPSLAEIRQRVIEVRQAKFADYNKVGTVGSFFKNLYLNKDEYKNLEKKISKNFNQGIFEKLKEIKNKFPDGDKIKIPTAFIIDKVLNLKGAKVGGAEISQTQALAIINPEKQATAKDVLSLFRKVRQEAYSKAGLVLENEPKFVGFSEEELQEYFELSGS